MKKIGKRALLLVTSSILICNLVGCKKLFKETKTVPNEIATYEKDSLANNSFYIMSTKEEKYEGFFTEGFTFTGSSYSIDNTRIIWEINRDHMIPTVNKDKKIIYVNNEKVPTSFTLEYFTDLGYTIGLKGLFLDNETGEPYYLASSPNHATGSSIADYAGKTELYGKELNVKIASINGREFTADDISPCGTFLGLEKDKSYTLELYRGTKYIKTDVISDTRVFYSQGQITLTNQNISYTKDGYVEIILPEGLSSGYYTIQEAGLFYYDSGVKASEAPTGAVVETTAQSEEQTTAATDN